MWNKMHAYVPSLIWCGIILGLEIFLYKPSWDLVLSVPFMAIAYLFAGVIVWIGSLALYHIVANEKGSIVDAMNSPMDSGKAMFLVIIASTALMYWHKIDQKSFAQKIVSCVERRGWRTSGDGTPSNVADWCVESLRQADADSPYE